jgi:leucyl aminopeptidase
VLYPESFVARVQPFADTGVAIRVLDGRKRAGHGRAAGRGAGQRAPRLLVLEWSGGARARRRSPCSKGVTFDTGGISLKPPRAWRT